MNSYSVATARRVDVIDQILGVEEDSAITRLRGQKPELAAQDQDYYRSLFEPEAASEAAFPLADRYLIAVRVASHTRSAAVVAWYAARAADAGVPAETIARVEVVASPWTDATGFAAAVRRADLVTTNPAATGASDIQALKDAGLTPAGIVALSQVIAFVSYQLRLIAALRALGGS